MGGNGRGVIVCLPPDVHGEVDDIGLFEIICGSNLDAFGSLMAYSWFILYGLGLG